ncbi:MAG TPA: PspC domain-containing protein [Steroidobacteraceae bacterium]|nr:PspC domain-containing protein [Steroidobacteraceae bacterium]
MRTVNTISLNGNAWQIESTGCEALSAYLKSAEARLASDPDREEILADLEQAIADKLARYVSAHKNVVSADEVALALQEMGPVETGAAGSGPDPGPGAAQAAQAQDNPPPPLHSGVRHLFQIREGAMLSGVCNGLAAYFGVDVTLVRVLFVVFTVLTGGVGGAVYLVMMIVVPVAVTAEQLAAAHGKPFSAEELIGRPRADYPAGRHWRQQWRDQRRMWREQRREWRRQRRAWTGSGAPGVPPPPPYDWQSAPYAGPYAGSGPVSAIVQVLLLIAFLVGLANAVAGRPLLGWDWTDDVPRWVGIVAVCVIYGTLAQQLRLARFYGHVGVYHPWHALMALVGTVVWLLVLACVGWYLVHHWPEVQDLLQRAVQALQAAFDGGPGSLNT